MDKKTLEYRNVREYRHAQLQDLIRELIRHRDHVQGAIIEIELQLAKIGKFSRRTDALEKTQRLIENDIALLRGIHGDLTRTIDELPDRVKGTHFRILSSIYATACEELEKADISRMLDEVSTKGKNRQLSRLIDETSGQYLGVVHSLLVLKDINGRLRSFFGQRLRQEQGSKEPAPSSDAADLEIPSGTTWENLRLEFQDIGDIRIRLKYRPFGVKNYRALGFENRAAAGDSPASGKPNRLWRTLAAFAYRDGNINWDNVPSDDLEALVKNVSDLRKHLKTIFKMTGSPITRYQRRRRGGDTGYSTVFEIAPIDADLFGRISEWVGGSRIYPAAVVQGADIDEVEIS